MVKKEYRASLFSSRKAREMGDWAYPSSNISTFSVDKLFLCMKSRMIFPTVSFPTSVMNRVGTPSRPSVIMELNVEPPGTACVGRPFLKMMSKMVSPMPITLRIKDFISIRVPIVLGNVAPNSPRGVARHIVWRRIPSLAWCLRREYRR